MGHSFKGLGVAFSVIAGIVGWVHAADPAKVSDPEIDRARQTVRMLDDIYKTAVALITDKYVHSEKDFSAGSAAVALFEAIEKKGWHRVRLIDVSGEPYDDKNVAQDDFEKKAVDALRAGKDFVEQTDTQDGRRVYRAVTPIPVVLEKCVMCHAHYGNAKAGSAVGALSYTIPMAP